MLHGFDGLQTVHRNVLDFGATGTGRTQDRAAIQAAIDNRTGLSAETLVEVRLPAGIYLTDGPLLLPSYTVLIGDKDVETTVRLSRVGLGALAQKTGLYDTLDRALSMVQVRDLSFDLLTNGVDPLPRREQYRLCWLVPGGRHLHASSSNIPRGQQSVLFPFRKPLACQRPHTLRQRSHEQRSLGSGWLLKCLRPPCQRDIQLGLRPDKAASAAR